MVSSYHGRGLPSYCYLSVVPVARGLDRLGPQFTSQRLGWK